MQLTVRMQWNNDDIEKSNSRVTIRLIPRNSHFPTGRHALRRVEREGGDEREERKSSEISTRDTMKVGESSTRAPVNCNILYLHDTKESIEENSRNFAKHHLHSQLRVTVGSLKVSLSDAGVQQLVQ